MNLLMVSPHLPDPSWGASTRSYYLLKALVREHSVSLLTLQDSSSEEIVTTTLQDIELKKMRQFVLPPTMQRKRFYQLLSILKGKSYLLDAYNIEELQREIDVLLAQDHYDGWLQGPRRSTRHHRPAQY